MKLHRLPNGTITTKPPTLRFSIPSKPAKGTAHEVTFDNQDGSVNIVYGVKPVTAEITGTNA